jgi:hypothetical protein
MAIGGLRLTEPLNEVLFEYGSAAAKSSIEC